MLGKLIISLASITLLLMLMLPADANQYGFMYIMNVNDLSIGYGVTATASRVIAVGMHYGALSGRCGTNEEGVYWAFTHAGDHVSLNVICYSTYGREYIYDAVSNSTTVYIAGAMRWIPSAQYDLNYDAVIARISENGTVVWARAYGSPTADEQFTAVAIMDHVYVTGSAGNSLLVAKLDKDTGNIIWAYSYSVPGYESTSGLSITAMNGYIYVLGTAAVQNTARNILLKLDANGNVISAWMTTSYIYGDVTAGDALYLAGTAITKLYDNGTVAWSRVLGFTAYSITYANGYLHLTGVYSNKPTAVKLAQDGSVVYAKTLTTYNGTGYGVTVAGSMTYITGYVLVSGYHRMFILGFTDGFTNEHVSDINLQTSMHQPQLQQISVQRTAVTLQQSSSGSAVAVTNYNPSPLFKGTLSTTAPTTTPTPAPTTHAFTTPEETIPWKLATAGTALLFILLLILIAIR